MTDFGAKEGKYRQKSKDTGKFSNQKIKINQTKGTIAPSLPLPRFSKFLYHLISHSPLITYLFPNHFILIT